MVLWAIVAAVEAVLWYVFIWWLWYRLFRGAFRKLNQMIARVEELMAVIEQLEERAALAAQELAKQEEPIQ